MTEYLFDDELHVECGEVEWECRLAWRAAWIVHVNEQLAAAEAFLATLPDPFNLEKLLRS
jgi:hypothetical protein